MINVRKLGPIAFAIAAFTPVAASAAQAEGGSGSYYDMKPDSDYFESRTQTPRVIKSPVQSPYPPETSSEGESRMDVSQPGMSSSPSSASGQGRRGEDR
ncbi:hypothetical protein [Thiorhodococcus fuscus]|uniref:Uncharacterized protein n=1 Tax=Thiorhodococcus fuscus TaxID=527200 RepID=A0ABW4Y6N5_9GAMM